MSDKMVLLADVTLALGVLPVLAVLPQRSRFFLRCLCSTAALAVLLCLAEVFLAGSSLLWLTAFVGAAYLLACLQVFFCCRLPGRAVLYYGVWAVMLPQLLLQLWDLLFQLWVNLGLVPRGLWWVGVPFCAAGNFLLYALLLRYLPGDAPQDIGPRQLISAIMLLAVFEILAEALMFDYRTILPTGNWAMLLICEVYCVTVLYLQNALFKKSRMQQELATMNLLWHQQKEQYDLSRETITLINRKCHDMKHQVRALRTMSDSRERAQYLDEIDDSIRIYEAIVKTGSDALDTILTEKSLRCREKNIQVHCVADGSRMGFIDPVDLYTIFGNALDNAIEEVQKFAEPEKREIDVLIYLKQQFLVINVSNPAAEHPRFADGLPVTTKGDNGYHGFGLKSVRHTVQKYGGYMTVGMEQNCFVLKILIPFPEGS